MGGQVPANDWKWLMSKMQMGGGGARNEGRHRKGANRRGGLTMASAVDAPAVSPQTLPLLGVDRVKACEIERSNTSSKA